MNRTKQKQCSSGPTGKQCKAKPKPSRFRSINTTAETLLTTLSLSGGLGSGTIAELLLHGEIETPADFVAISVDPGMENPKTIEYLNELNERFKSVGMDHRIVKSNLYGELLAAIESGTATRFDFPPFWTRNRETGKRGRLLQRCTAQYKITPIKRVVRDVLLERHGIAKNNCRLPRDCVRSWIGFSADETQRVKESSDRYIWFQYPLIALGMDRYAALEFYKRIGRTPPPRSVCAACFANDLPFFKEMERSRPEQWAQAVAVDEAIRDLSAFGVRDECFVSRTLIPLKQLAADRFEVGDQPLLDWAGCHSGFCFT